MKFKDVFMEEHADPNLSNHPEHNIFLKHGFKLVSKTKGYDGNIRHEYHHEKKPVIIIANHGGRYESIGGYSLDKDDNTVETVKNDIKLEKKIKKYL